jgi:hypothetical protein
MVCLLVQAPARRPTPRALLADDARASQKHISIDESLPSSLPPSEQQQPQEEEAAAGPEDPTRGHPGGQGACQRLLWFTCLGGRAADDPDSRYLQFLKAAVLSARRHAPSLVPVLIYGGQQPDLVTRWFAEQGGTVVYHTLSFLPDLQRAGNESWSAKLVRMQVGIPS